MPFTQNINTTKPYGLTPMTPLPDAVPAAIVGSVSWSSSVPGYTAIVPDADQGLTAEITLGNNPGTAVITAAAVNTNGVPFSSSFIIEMTTPPPPPPAADHFDVVQDPA